MNVNEGPIEIDANRVACEQLATLIKDLTNLLTLHGISPSAPKWKPETVEKHLSALRRYFEFCDSAANEAREDERQTVEGDVTRGAGANVDISNSGERSLATQLSSESFGMPPAKYTSDDFNYSCYHLSESISEICKLVIDEARGHPGESINTFRLAHAYNHLNWFWNGRNRPDKSRWLEAEGELESYSVFPRDLVVNVGRGFGTVITPER